MKKIIRYILKEEVKLILEKMDRQDFIDKANLVHDSKYDYSLVDYKNTTTPVKIICPTHDVFSQIPKSHLKGYGCWECGVEKRKDNRRLNTNDFITKAKEVHGNKYDYSFVVYKNNSDPVEIVCPIHGKFPQQPQVHLSGSGCKDCGIAKRANSQRKLQVDFVKKSNQVHHNEYDYSKTFYQGANTKVEIICYDHGSFFQLPGSHTKGHGCPTCAFEKVSDDKRLSKEEFISKAEEKHLNKFDYSLVKYKNYTTPVVIICPLHGKKFQTPASHLQSPYGCNDCAFEQQLKKQSKTTQDFISDANGVHGIDKYDYSLVDYKNSKTNVKIICKNPNHGIFQQTPSNHLKGQGCPKCNESQGEKFVDSLLKDMNIQFIRQKKFIDCTNKIQGRYCRKLPFDFFLPEQNAVIEYDGQGHFKPIEVFGGEKSFLKQKEYDNIKNQYCIDKGIKMIRIPYTMDKSNIKSFIQKSLNMSNE